MFATDLQSFSNRVDQAYKSLNPKELGRKYVTLFILEYEKEQWDNKIVRVRWPKRSYLRPSEGDVEGEGDLGGEGQSVAMASFPTRFVAIKQCKYVI